MAHDEKSAEPRGCPTIELEVDVGFLARDPCATSLDNILVNPGRAEVRRRIDAKDRTLGKALGEAVAVDLKMADLRASLSKLDARISEKDEQITAHLDIILPGGNSEAIRLLKVMRRFLVFLRDAKFARLMDLMEEYELIKRRLLLYRRSTSE